MSHCDFAPTEDVNRIERARRALVYVTVDWSMPERHARAVVRAAVDAIPPALDVDYFTVQEDGRAAAPWLASHGWPASPRGYGSLLWFDRGNLVATELLPAQVGIGRIIAQTLALWGQS